MRDQYSDRTVSDDQGREWFVAVRISPPERKGSGTTHKEARDTFLRFQHESEALTVRLHGYHAAGDFSDEVLLAHLGAAREVKEGD